MIPVNTFNESFNLYSTSFEKETKQKLLKHFQDTQLKLLHIDCRGLHYSFLIPQTNASSITWLAHNETMQPWHFTATNSTTQRKENKSIIRNLPYTTCSDDCTSHTWDIVAMVWLWLTVVFYHVITETSSFPQS